jgi:hypothetical protein
MKNKVTKLDFSKVKTVQCPKCGLIYKPDEKHTPEECRRVRTGAKDDHGLI